MILADTIKVTAAVNKVQTLADGGLRWTFDLPETAVIASAHLMECKRVGVALNLQITPVKTLTELDDETKEKAESGASGMDRRRYADG